jgi:hypothetical protein
MRIFSLAVQLVISTLLLSACTTGYRWNQKLIVEINTPAGVKKGAWAKRTLHFTSTVKNLDVARHYMFGPTSGCAKVAASNDNRGVIPHEGLAA